MVGATVLFYILLIIPTIYLFSFFYALIFWILFIEIINIWLYSIYLFFDMANNAVMILLAKT